MVMALTLYGRYYVFMFWHVVGSQLPDGLDMCSKEERAELRIAIFSPQYLALNISHLNKELKRLDSYDRNHMKDQKI